MKEILFSQRELFNTNITKSYDFRIANLEKLETAIIKYKAQFLEALFLDLGKSETEAYMTEVGFVLNSIKLNIKQLKKWMKPKKVKTPLFMLGSKSYIVREPLGSVLIIGPYNYPFQLIFEPLIGAIASGNTIVIKPSEYTVNTEKLINKVIGETFDANYISVITGGKEVTGELIKQPFDHIFFTGSTEVGKIVYKSAAENLTPVTLELGGKSPVIIDETANLKLAARRIAFGKFVNLGQTCIAPDYIYIKPQIEQAFIKELSGVIRTFYPNNEGLGKIVNKRHYNRLKDLIDDNKVVFGNELNEVAQFISPTIMNNVTWDDLVMQEEIFGPLLPILTYTNLDTIVETIKSKAKPLALYMFSEDNKNINKVFNELSFGNGAINDTLMQVANPNLPFGGVGRSGMGRYHGETSFDTFSNLKTYTRKTTKYDLKIAYPPYTDKKTKLIKRLLK